MTHCKTVFFCLFVTIITSVSFAASTDPCSVEGVCLSNIMKDAAYLFASVDSGRDSIAAADLNGKGTLADAIASGNASVQKNWSRTYTDSGNVRSRGPNRTMDASVTGELRLGLSYISDYIGAQIGVDTQKSAQRALQMQLATEAVTSYLTYSSDDYKLLYYIKFLNKLKAIKATVGDGTNGTVTLKPTQLGLLNDDIVDAKTQIKNFLAERKNQAADLKKFIGKEKLSRFAKIMEVKARTRVQEELDEQKNPLDLEAIYKLFPVPKTAAEVIAKSDNNPGVQQAYLAIKTAQNGRFSVIAGYLPYFAVGVTKSLSTSYSTTTAADNYDARGTTAYASVNWTIGAGFPLRLKASGLLIRANQKSLKATKLNLTQVIEQDYSGLANLSEQFPDQIEGLGETVKIFMNIVPQADPADPTHDASDDVDNVDRLYRDCGGLVTGISNEIIQLVGFRMDVHTAMGDLLGQIDVLKKLEADPDLFSRLP